MKETRIKKIFDTITHSDKPLTSQDIATSLNCSSKTIRNDIKYLNSILENNGARIETVRSMGSVFKIEDNKKFENFLKESWNSYAFENDDYTDRDKRIRFILRILLFASEYIKAQELIDELCISRSLFNRELRVVRYMIKPYDLEIISKPYQGLRIEGRELDKRLCIANTLLNKDTDNSIFYNKNVEDYKSFLGSIQKIIIEVLKSEKYETTEVAFNNLLIHMFICIKRILSGDNVSVGKNEIIRLCSKNEYKIAKKLTDRLSSEFNIEFPDDEIAYISIHLLSKKISLNHNKLNIAPEIEILVDKIIDRIKEVDDVDLTRDLDLKISLCLHLSPLIERIRYKLVLKNPILEEIKKDLFSFMLAKTGMSVIENKYNIILSEDEIAYIAIHISVALNRLHENKKKKNVLIVCGSGVGTANLVRYNFEKRYKEHVNEIHTCDYLGLNNVDFSNIDLVVTTIPISLNVNIPVIEIGIFINEKDVKNIFKHLIDKDLDIAKLFSDELFFKNNRLYHKEDVLKFLTNKIEEVKGIEQKKLYDLIIKRENFASTSYDTMVSLPHPMISICKESFITVFINPKGINWDNKVVKVVILLNIKKEDGKGSYIINSFFKYLSKYISNSEAINKSIQFNSLDEFLKFFIDLENNDEIS